MELKLMYRNCHPKNPCCLHLALKGKNIDDIDCCQFCELNKNTNKENGATS